MAKKLIALSDGHGMSTPGKRSPALPNGLKGETGANFFHENEYNRAVVKYLNEELKRNGFDTLLVAPTDADTSLAARVNLANNKGADLYVSIHANANTGVWGDWGGIETYVYPGGESYRIGTKIHIEMIKNVTLRDRGLKNGSHLYEIRKTKMPSVLVEGAFMDGHMDYKYLMSDQYRKDCAVKICKGICNAYGVTYKTATKAASPTSSPSPKTATKPAENKSKPQLTLPTGTYKKGSKAKAAVTQIQKALNQLNFKCGAEDGIFGEKTTDALRRFQSVYTPKAIDGIYGKNTRAAMLQELKKQYDQVTSN